MDVVTVNVCTVHVVQYICTDVHICFSSACTYKCMYDQYLCSYFCPHVLLVCIYIRMFTILLYMHVVYLFLPHVMHCWLSALYRTGLIKDLLLCSGYRDSSSLRPS